MDIDVALVAKILAAYLFVAYFPIVVGLTLYILFLWPTKVWRSVISGGNRAVQRRNEEKEINVDRAVRRGRERADADRKIMKAVEEAFKSQRREDN